jgi:hypothetical protein
MEVAIMEVENEPNLDMQYAGCSVKKQGKQRRRHLLTVDTFQVTIYSLELRIVAACFNHIL